MTTAASLVESADPDPGTAARLQVQKLQLRKSWLREVARITLLDIAQPTAYLSDHASGRYFTDLVVRRVRVAPVVVAGGVALVVDQALPAQLELVGRGEGLNRVEQKLRLSQKIVK